MNIQITGKKKCRNTRKAERYFKERGVKFFSLDLHEKPLSPGELKNIMRTLDLADLVDKDSKLYKEQFAFMDFDAFEELLAHPDLIQTPIVRCDGKASIGYSPSTWKKWLGG